MGRGVVQLEGAFLSRSGRRLWVEHAGNGPTIVFAHAAIADRRMWDDPFAQLAGRYHVVRYDQPGYGRSDAASERYSPVDDLRAVLNHVGADQAALVGCSMGGGISVDYTLAHPNRVAALVPVAAAVSGYRYSWPSEPDGVDLKAAIEANDLRRLTLAATRLWAPLRTEPAVDTRIEQLLVDNLDGIATMGRLWLDHPPAYGRLSEIHVPTLVVAGDGDLLDFLRVAELLAGETAGARLVVLPGVDHNVPLRAGRVFTELLATFLDELDPWP